MIRTLVIVTIAWGLIGCTGVQKPRAEVVAVQPGETSPQGAVVSFTVMLANPNDIALPVRKVSYHVAVDGETFDFDATPPVAMPVYGQQMFTLPAAFPLAGESLTGRTVDVTGRVYYQPPGKLREALTDMKIPLPHASFAATATLE